MDIETVHNRDEIDAKYTWNASSVFESVTALEDEFASISRDLDSLAAFEGHLGDGSGVLADARDNLEILVRRVQIVRTYTVMDYSVDTGNQEAAARLGKAQALSSKALAAIAFFEPELLAIGRETLEQWIGQEPRIGDMGHYVDDLFRRQSHVRSGEVEQLLGMLADSFSGPSLTAAAMTNADFQFPPAVASDGKEVTVTQGTLSRTLSGKDREARRTAWENYYDTYLGFKNTLANNLATSIKQNVFMARARHHDSTLAAVLSEDNIPVEVFHNLIATFRKNLPTWHRYWGVRRRALGVDTLYPYDIWAPLTSDKAQVNYQQAVDWICDGLNPMGQGYVDTIRRGCLENRWVDVYPNKGKRAGAFSAGSPGTHPFIMMSFNDDLFSLSTLAHELGHSMHSYLTWQNQPVIYSDYSLFVAETASNFHQAMVRAHLLEIQSDPVFRINLIEEAMSNFYRYFFVMPTLARFELETHKRVEKGQGIVADDMIELMADLFQEGYGDEVHVDRERVGMTWATFGHLYRDYYVYQYATGISGAYALSKRILTGEENAVNDYLSFLKAGSSMYALDALKLAGVDLTTTEPVEVAFEVLAESVDTLEQLVSA
jgi:oligoendopeptidase F